MNSEDIPEWMFINGAKIGSNDLEEAFADFFESKVKHLSDNTIVNVNIYNGMRKLSQIDEFNFMNEPNVRKAMESLKLKNAEGHDRIPQRLLIDGAEILNKPMHRGPYGRASIIRV